MTIPEPRQMTAEQERDYYRRQWLNELKRRQEMERNLATIRELLGIRQCYGECCSDY